MLTETQVIERLRAACAAAGGQKAFARTSGLTPAYVGDVLHGRRPPADRILDALGLERVTIYREKDTDQDTNAGETTTKRRLTKQHIASG